MELKWVLERISKHELFAWSLFRGRWLMMKGAPPGFQTTFIIWAAHCSWPARWPAVVKSHGIDWASSPWAGKHCNWLTRQWIAVVRRSLDRCCSPQITVRFFRIWFMSAQRWHLDKLVLFVWPQPRFISTVLILSINSTDNILKIKSPVTFY